MLSCRMASMMSPVVPLSKATGGAKKDKAVAEGEVTTVPGLNIPPPISVSAPGGSGGTMASLLKQHAQLYWGNISSRPVELASFCICFFI